MINSKRLMSLLESMCVRYQHHTDHELKDALIYSLNYIREVHAKELSKKIGGTNKRTK